MRLLALTIAGALVAQMMFGAVRQAHTFDGSRLVLHGHEHVTIATIVRERNGHLSIAIAATHRYQWAFEVGDGYRAGSRVAREFYELSRFDLGRRAAVRPGWRNPLQIDRFVLPVCQFETTAKDGRAYVDVRRDAAGDFLIVITKVYAAPTRE